MAALGYKPGPADGRWGPRTGRAYAAFLRDRGMPRGNVLSPDALRALRAAAKGRNVAASAASPKGSSTTRRKAGRSSANLHRLVAAGDVDGLKAALTRGLDVNARDGKGWTPLVHAADKGQALLVPLLLKAGADPNLRLADGATAIFIAALHGHIEIVTMLVDAGASLKLKGPKGQTVVDVMKAKYGDYYRARERGEERIVLSILRAGITAADIAYFIRKKFDRCRTYKRIWYGGTSYVRHSVELESNRVIKLLTHVTNLAHEKSAGRSTKVNFDEKSKEKIRYVEVTKTPGLVIYYVDGRRYKSFKIISCNNRDGLEIALEIARALTNCYDDSQDRCREDAKPTEKYWLTSLTPVR